ncbi:MAG: hypothetical protein JXA92_04510 [candidate division Zixibacteria bacterium]|nr:hypothetical protein [candidate division Zixibacteria bacterium]
MTVKIKAAMLVFIALGFALAVVVNLTDVCRLEAVALDGRDVDGWDKKYGLDEHGTVFSQPLDNLALQLLGRRDIARVEIDYHLPDGLEITTNDFEPVCFVVSRYGGRLYGLDEQARVISLDRGNINWEHPCLTNVKVSRLFEMCGDYRVNLVVSQLEELRRQHLDLYRLVNEIDFESDHFLLVSVSGLSFRLKVKAESFLRQFNVFIRFLESFNTHLDSVRVVDLRFDDMIITVGKDI